MKNRLFKKMILLGMMLNAYGLAATGAEETPLDLPDEVPAATNPPTVSEKNAETSEKSVNEATMEIKEVPQTLEAVRFGLRMEPGFLVGSPSQQGFTLFSARFSVYGDLSRQAQYRFSLGQTREYANALLPQFLPIEAYLRFSNFFASDYPRASVQIGIFRPTLHPLWGPDLSDVDAIDYSSVQKDLLLANDIGLEGRVHSDSFGLTLAAGVFNGNGIMALNNNNTKAITSFIRKDWGDKTNSISLGGSFYWLSQSARGSINFKSNWAGVAFLELVTLNARLRVMGELFSSQFEDSTRSVSPRGGAGTVWLSLSPDIRLFARWENLSASPLGSGAGRDVIRIGPIFDLSQDVKLFTHYEGTSYGDGTAENQLIVRARLNL